MTLWFETHATSVDNEARLASGWYDAALSALGWEGSEAIIADSSADSALERALDDSSFGTRITATRQAVGAA